MYSQQPLALWFALGLLSVTGDPGLRHWKVCFSAGMLLAMARVASNSEEPVLSNPPVGFHLALRSAASFRPNFHGTGDPSSLGCILHVGDSSRPQASDRAQADIIY